MKSIKPLVAGVACLLISNSALAITIDFTQADADGASSWSTTEEGVTVDVVPGPEGSELYWDSTDGFGVRYSYETDEIEGTETLSVFFSEAVEIISVLVTDLFYESGYLEEGSYALDDGESVDFQADPSQVRGTNGELLLSGIGESTSITFSAPGQVDGENHEFSLASLSFERISSVPELSAHGASSAFFLVGGGIAVAAGRVRRRRPRRASRA